LIPDPVCDICGLPQVHQGLCSRCQQNLPAFKVLRSWTVFENPVQTALHRLKYRRDIGLGEMLAGQMSEFVKRLNWPVEVILPIPLGKKRLRERGYNQVAMVALPLSLQLGLDYLPSAPARARETRSQVGLSAVERQENVQDAFQADPKKVNGHTASGAREVYAVTIARALPHHSLKVV
jgi:predicted amidophosphoribosyltransferase